MPQLQARRQTSTVPDFGPEPQLAGTFVGTLDEIVEFVGAQGVILGLANIPEGEEGEDEKRYRVRWGGGVDAGVGLQVLANQLGAGVLSLRRGPDTYVIGTPSDQDLEARVLYVSAELAEDYLVAIRALSSDTAQVASVGDVIVIKDTPAGMRVIEDLYESINAARGQWIVEVRFIELSDTAAKAIGMDLEASGQLAVDLAGSLSGLSLTDAITARLDGLITADAEQEHVRTITTSRLHVIEGEEAELQVGSTVPVPMTVDRNLETGLVNTEFEDVDTGVLLKVGVRTEPDGRLRVYMRPEVSEITGFVQDRPIRSRRRIETAGVLEPGGSLIAGGFFQDRHRNQQQGLPGLLDSKLTAMHDESNERSRIYITLRVLDPDNIPAPVEATADDRPRRSGPSGADLLHTNTDHIHYAAASHYAPGN